MPYSLNVDEGCVTLVVAGMNTEIELRVLHAELDALASLYDRCLADLRDANLTCLSLPTIRNLGSRPPRFRYLAIVTQSIGTGYLLAHTYEASDAPGQAIRVFTSEMHALTWLGRLSGGGK